MLRTRILQALDGSHPRIGGAVAFALNGAILLSATAIALQTVQDLPAWAHQVLVWTEFVVVVIFALEYAARLICAPRPLAYIFSFWGIVDLISILPLLALVNPEWAALRSIRLIRLVRLLKLIRSSRALDRMQDALTSVRGDLTVFAVMASIIVYIAAVGIYIFEHDAQPDVFGSIPEAAWWAIVSFTTVGYGDSYPITAAGRMFTTGILFVGLGIIALPTAAITTALIDQSRKEQTRKELHDQALATRRVLQPPSPRHGHSGRRSGPK